MTEQKTVNNLNDANQANALNQVAEAGPFQALTPASHDKRVY